MALDPNIALGVRPIEIANPLAQYSQIAQIQNAQQANQLNQLRMEEYQLEKQNKNALSQAYAQSFDPASGKLDYNKLTGLLASGGQGTQIPGILKLRTEEERATTEEAARRAKLMADTQTMYQNLSNQIGSKQDAIMFLQRMVNDPSMKDAPITRIPLMEQVRRIPEDKDGLDNWIKQFSLGATKYFTENKPVTFAQDTGAGGRLMSRPGLGGTATVVPGSEFTKTPTIGERTAQANLNLAQQKFAYEQANPGFELKEGEDGTFYGVNKRTLQAVPVTVGAPAAAGAAPTAATPLKGKGKDTALTESQGNATAFGMRMMESNKILKDLETAGKKDTGLIKGVVGGAVGLIPFIGDKLEDASGSIFNALPQVLGGLSPEQQRVAQARINFITALLRKESGAAISASEFATAEKNYFPKPGEGADVIKQKQQARETAIKAMQIQAGPGARQMGGGGGGALPGASANNPLGLPGL